MSENRQMLALCITNADFKNVELPHLSALLWAKLCGFNPGITTDKKIFGMVNGLLSSTTFFLSILTLWPLQMTAPVAFVFSLPFWKEKQLFCL